ncbi:hypothetical protein EDB80DRAFT_682046 [Ilyonectria destructans]|nr:hypothetical protein EDB80DRAFT_682046 [Ilyonectria destructans]
MSIYWLNTCPDGYTRLGARSTHITLPSQEGNRAAELRFVDSNRQPRRKDVAAGPHQPQQGAPEPHPPRSKSSIGSIPSDFGGEDDEVVGPKSSLEPVSSDFGGEDDDVVDPPSPGATRSNGGSSKHSARTRTDTTASSSARSVSEPHSFSDTPLRSRYLSGEEDPFTVREIPRRAAMVDRSGETQTVINDHRENLRTELNALKRHYDKDRWYLDQDIEDQMPHLPQIQEQDQNEQDDYTFQEMGFVCHFKEVKDGKGVAAFQYRPVRPTMLNIVKRRSQDPKLIIRAQQIVRKILQQPIIHEKRAQTTANPLHARYIPPSCRRIRVTFESRGLQEFIPGLDIKAWDADTPRRKEWWSTPL